MGFNDEKLATASSEGTAMGSAGEMMGNVLGVHTVDAGERLAEVVELMRELSRQTDPQQMVRTYSSKVRTWYRTESFLALSRRGLEFPSFRITRSSEWREEVNPWRDKDRLPLLQGGLLGELIYGDEPRIINDLKVSENDPAYNHLRGQRSLMAIPNYDQGVALNMTIRMSSAPDAFDRATLPEHVWLSNLFGLATHSLVLSDELKRAYEIVDHELKTVAAIQRSLLPREIPQIPTLGLAAHYQTSQWAGGDYYDFFPLPDDKWGIMIADVSGHGTPAAVMMAITHSIAHTYPGPPDPPGKLLTWVNDRLAQHYTADNESFVTAFYGIYDPARRELTYACAGHNPPRLKRCFDGTIDSIDGVSGLPLGVMPGEIYEQKTRVLIPGDQLVLYTDGITEATNAKGEMFGLEKLDQVLENCHLTADGLIEEVLSQLDAFTAGQPPADDRTLLIAKVS
jgi:sigma-B regulation protein RsbU (phosphoserine phosphatase)